MRVERLCRVSSRKRKQSQAATRSAALAAADSDQEDDDSGFADVGFDPEQLSQAVADSKQQPLNQQETEQAMAIDLTATDSPQPPQPVPEQEFRYRPNIIKDRARPSQTAERKKARYFQGEKPAGHEWPAAR